MIARHPRGACPTACGGSFAGALAQALGRLGIHGALLCAASACAPGAFDKYSDNSARLDAGPDADSSVLEPVEPVEASVEPPDGEAGVEGGEPTPDAHVPDTHVPDTGAGETGTIPATCATGTSECVGITSERLCNGDAQWDEPLACAYACVGMRCGGSCRPGQRQCQDKQRQLCDDRGAWANDGAPCPNLCKDGACSGACAPDATQCVSATQVQTCNVSGQWAPAKACQFACVGDRCGGTCVPATRGCGAQNTPRVCTNMGTWRSEAACTGLTPICEGAGRCRCRTGQRRCAGTQPRVCDASGQWIDTGAPCANCTGEGQCPNEGCDEANIQRCAGFCGCGCVNNDCSGGFDWTRDGCTTERRTACADVGCRCVDGGCSGGMCDGSGCTVGKEAQCKRDYGEACGCWLAECVGDCVPQL